MDDEVRANPEHCRLQRQPQHLRDSRRDPRRVAHAPVAREVGLIDGIPAPREMRDHAHGHQSLGVSPARFNHGIARLRASLAVVLVGLSVSHSVKIVRRIRMKAPIVAVMPIQKWKTKQIPR